MWSILFRLFVYAGIAAAGAWAAHHWDEGEIADLKLAQSQAQTRAVLAQAKIVRAQDAVSLAAAVTEASAQQKIADEAHLIPKEIRIHVPSASRICIPFGLVRVLDAATTGADPAGLPLPAGQSDAGCAPVDAAALAQSVAGNYVTARANAEQLSALQDWVRDEARATAPKRQD
jgi:hypothetical protein